MVLDGALVVAGEAAVAHEPAEGPLHDPPPPDQLEAVRVAALDDLDGDAGEGPGAVCEVLAGVAAVGPHELQRGEHGRQADEQEFRAGFVADGGGGDDQRQQPALGVGDQVTAPAGDLLPFIPAPG